MRRLRQLIRPSQTFPLALVCALAPLGNAAAAQPAAGAATATATVEVAPKGPVAPAPAAPNNAAVAPAAASGGTLVTVPAVNDPSTVPGAPAGEAAPAQPADQTMPVPASPVASVVPAPAPTVAVVPVKPLPPAEPLAAYFDVGVVVQTQWNTNRAYDYFSDNDLSTKGGVVIGADIVDFQPAVLALDLNALFTENSSDGPLPTYIRNGKLKETNLGAGLTLRYSLWSWLAPQVRVGGGVALQKSVLNGVDFGERRQDFTTGYLMLGGGFAFTIPPHRLSRTRTYLNSLGLRVIVEGGYHLGQDLEFAIEGRAANESDPPNAIAETRLGTLPQSGAYLRGALQARF